MKNFTILLLVLFEVFVASAQQKPYFTQYIMNNYILNPAITGIENYTDVKLSYRKQWSDIPGAPVTMYFSAHAPIGKDDYRTTATSFDVPGENPRGKAYWESYTAAKPHGGIGLVVMNDKSGYISRSSVYATIAYHLGLSPKASLAAGFIGGASMTSLDRTKIEWATLDPNDPAIGYNYDLKKIKPEVGAGLWLYSSDYFVGASVLNIVPGKISFIDKEIYGATFTPQFLATAGYRFFISDDVSALPSVMVQFVQPFPVQVHCNLKLQYQDVLWGGLSYRTGDELGGFAAMAGINISSIFNLSYAYDVSGNSRLRPQTGNTHELILGFLLNNKYSDKCPQNVW